MRSVYVHIPFCKRRCRYCDFNTYAGLDDLQEQYVAALCTEIMAGPEPGSEIDTLFVGGGTPTVLAAAQLDRVLAAVGNRYTLAPQCEITVECNPSTAEAAMFRELVAMGVTRLSMGVQSWRDDELAMLGRTHSASEALRAYGVARAAGFCSVSLDLMFGLPGQDPSAWEESLLTTARLQPDHISAYCLILEPGTPLTAAHASGQVPAVDDEAAATMLEMTWDFLPDHGWPQYEISNFAQPEAQCRHNITYWHNEPYAGFGAGAVSYIDGERATRARPPREYIRRIAGQASSITESETLSLDEAVGETFMLGLRMTAGVGLQQVEERFGAGALAKRQPVLERLARDGKLRRHDGRVALTRQGMLVANDIMAELL